MKRIGKIIDQKANKLKWYHKNRERILKYKIDYQRKKKYNLSRKDYDTMVKNQNGVCAICHGLCTRHDRLSVDHCHTTNKVRGLLCDRCNRGLGNFKDNITFLNRAIEYLSPFHPPNKTSPDENDSG